MIKLAGVAFQIGFDLAQAPRSAKLRIQQPNQMSPGLHHAIIPVGIVFIHKPVDDRPWNMLQKAMKNDILMRHGVDPFSCPDDSQPPGTQ
jgi:hypothetical protein